MLMKSPENQDLEPKQPWIHRYADAVIRHRWRVIGVSLLITMVMGMGARHLGFGSNYRLFFSGENPELVAFEDFQATYTKTDNIMFVLQPESGDLATPRMSALIERLTDEAWNIPYSIRVDSLSNFQNSWADGDDLTVDDLIRDGAELSEEQAAEKIAVALAEPLLKNNLISADAVTTGINVTFQYPEEDIMEVPKAAAKARAIAADLRAEFPEVKIVLTGLSMLNNSFAESAIGDMGLLIPLMYLILVVVMIATVRSLSGTIASLLVIVFATMAAMGAGGYFGIKLLPVSALAPTIVLTLAIADSIHILITMRKAMGSGMEKVAAIKESLRVNFMPVTITSLTTIVGFLALNFSDSPPFWHLGNMTAIGIAAAWLLSISFLPALMSLLPFKPARPRPGVVRATLLQRYADFVVAHHRPVLIVAGLLAIGLSLLAPRNEINDEWVKYFDHRVEFRGDAEFAMDHLTGLYALEFSINADGPGGISKPEYLEALDGYVSWLRSQPEIVHVFSYTDIIKRLNKNMHADDPGFYRIPDNNELAAQYQLLYELSLPYGLDLNDRVSIDKGATRVTVTLPEISTRRVSEFMERSSAWLEQNAPAYMYSEATGPTPMFAKIAERNINSMFKGNALAILIIAAVMIGALRSWGIGLLSLIPNTLPILITFGLWSLLVGSVGLAAATVAATSLGIIVDDSVHFLSKYLHGRRHKGLSNEDAVRYAFETVGSAIITTTLILSAGFAWLAYSTFLINAQMGLLTAIAILVAFVFDFTVLPALLLFRSKQAKQTNETTNEKENEMVIPTPTAA